MNDRAAWKKLRMSSSSAVQNNEAYMEELGRMEAGGMRAEIEALYSQGNNNLCDYITQKIVRREYI
jgi:DNA topoisomerase VI subunit A